MSAVAKDRKEMTDGGEAGESGWAGNVMKLYIAIWLHFAHFKF